MEKKKRDFEPERGWLVSFLSSFLGGIGWLFRQSWRAISALLRGCGRLIAAGFRGMRQVIAFPFRLTWSILVGIWHWFTGTGGRPQYSDPTHEAIRRRVEARFRRRTRFFSHLVIFGFANGGLWLIGIIEMLRHGGYIDFASMAFFTGLWTMFLVLHLVRYLMGEEKERTIAEEIAREQQRRPTATEPDDDLAERAVRLSDDGELVYDDDGQQNHKPKRR